jgi:hypothetical protein
MKRTSSRPVIFTVAAALAGGGVYLAGSHDVVLIVVTALVVGFGITWAATRAD